MLIEFKLQTNKQFRLIWTGKEFTVHKQIKQSLIMVRREEAETASQATTRLTFFVRTATKKIEGNKNFSTV